MFENLILDFFISDRVCHKPTLVSALQKKIIIKLLSDFASNMQIDQTITRRKCLHHAPVI